MGRLPPGLHFIQAPSESFPASANMVCAPSTLGVSLIDTGGSGSENHRVTAQALSALGHAPRDVQRVLLTHAHADHSGGLSLLSPQVRVGLHSTAHPMARSAEAFFDTFDFALIRERYPDPTHPGRQRTQDLEEYLAHGDCPFEPFRATEEPPATLELAGQVLNPILGSGHAPGHLMFHFPELKLLVAGDLVGHQLAWHSPKSGGAAGYLDALERAHGLAIDTIWPAHGPPIEEARPHIMKLRDKLLRREDKLLAALSGGSKTFNELLLSMVGAQSEEDIALFPAVPMLEGHLRRLEDNGQIRRSGPAAAHTQRVERV